MSLVQPIKKTSSAIYVNRCSSSYFERHGMYFSPSCVYFGPLPYFRWCDLWFRSNANVSDNSSMRRILLESAWRHVSWVQAEFLEENNSYTELCYI